MEIKIQGNTLILENPNPDLGNHLIYKTPIQLPKDSGRGTYTEWVPAIPFKVMESGSWEFPTVQWIYPLMSMIRKNGFDISNKDILSKFKSTESLIKNPYHLYQNQIDCLNTMTSYSHGISILRTGAGKTTMISVLAKNLYDRGMKILVMAPTNGVLHEIRDRFTRDFGIDCNYYFDPTKNIHFVNPRGLFKSNKFWLHDPYWDDIDCIIMDEVENCMNEKFLRVLDRINRPKYMYGFSGTANKVTAAQVFFDTNKNIPTNEMNLIKYLGWTAWYEKPADRVVNFIKISDKVNMRKLTDEEFKDTFNSVPKILTTSRSYYSLIYSLFERGHVSNLYIPFVSRVAISTLTDELDLPLGLITGSGFQYRLKLGDPLINCSLDELKELARTNEIKVIIGSRSSFAGIDLPPNWDSSLANSIGNLANSTIQAAGRVARSEVFNLFYFKVPSYIPLFNRQVTQTLNLMRSYYSECETHELSINLNL